MIESRYPPDLFALIHRGTAGDMEFYREVCQSTDSVLELGCGYGRLIPELVATGTHYFGLELSPELLRLARRVRAKLPERKRGRVSLRAGDMRDFQFKRRFDRILLPHSTLYCLPDDRSVLACLRCAKAHLSEGGQLVLDAYCADDFHYRLDPKELTGKQREYLTRVESRLGSYLVFERTRWIRSKQRFVVTYEHESERGKLLQGTVEHRYLLRGQLERLLERAGFEHSKWAGNFRGGRLKTRSEQLVVQAWG
ncbi:MAG: class I SAM-dependent methyltransferase [Myxococcales bacterium]